MSKLVGGEIRVQVNLLLPLKWKEKLEDLSRKESVKKSRTINYQELIRNTLDQHLKLSK